MWVLDRIGCRPLVNKRRRQFSFVSAVRSRKRTFAECSIRFGANLRTLTTGGLTWTLRNVFWDWRGRSSCLSGWSLTEGPVLFRSIDCHGHLCASRLAPADAARVVKKLALRAGLDPARRRLFSAGWPRHECGYRRRF